MSTTSTKSPHEVKEELLRVLRAMQNLEFREKGCAFEIFLCCIMIVIFCAA